MRIQTQIEVESFIRLTKIIERLWDWIISVFVGKESM